MTPRPDRVIVYRDHANRWRWRKLAPNGLIVSTSGKAFASRRNAHRAAARELQPHSCTLQYAP